VTYTLLAVWSFVCLFPVYWVAITSIKGVEDIDRPPGYVRFLDFWPSLDAWRFVLFEHNENLVSRLVNSALIALVLPIYVLAQAPGTRDTLLLMIFVYTAINIPVATWLLLPVLGSKATEQEEAAQLDGASHLATFFTILLPMVRAGVVATGLIVFLMCWNEYLFAAYLTADNALTLPPWAVGQLSMKEAQVGGGAEEWAHLSAATIVMIFPTLVFAAFALKHLSRAATRR
jgi:ABC-type glycerol-3-phosphate transport system permease component